MGSKIVYHLFVNGTPKPQPRPRVTSKGHAYNPDSANIWKEEIKVNFLSVIRGRPPITGPVFLRVSFFLPAPKVMKINQDGKIPHDKKPDLDNLLKAVKDAMTEAGVWRDDSQVYAGDISKWYSGGRTGAQIIVETTI